MNYKLAEDQNLNKLSFVKFSDLEYDKNDENCQIVALKMIEKKRIKNQKNYVSES